MTQMIAWILFANTRNLRYISNQFLNKLAFKSRSTAKNFWNINNWPKIQLSRNKLSYLEEVSLWRMRVNLSSLSVQITGLINTTLMPNIYGRIFPIIPTLSINPRSIWIRWLTVIKWSSVSWLPNKINWILKKVRICRWIN